jgi:hypothetical protein
MSEFEKIEHTAPPPASPRSVGYTFAAVSAIAAILLRDNANLAIGLCGVAGLFALTAWLVPQWLKGPAFLWSKLALLIAAVVNPIVMGIMFYGLITPYGLLLRMGRDPLRIHKRPQAASYWLESTDPQGKAAMERQF